MYARRLFTASRRVRATRAIIRAAGLLPVFAGVHLVAYALRFEGYLGPREWELVAQTAFWAVATKVLIFACLGVFHSWSRYVTFHDLMALAKATTASSFLLAVIDYLALPWVHVPRSVFLMDWGVTIVVVGGLWSLRRLIQERNLSLLGSSRVTPVFIVGANDSGEALLRAIRRCPQLAYRAVGFVAEDESSVATSIGGVPVVGVLNELPQLVGQFGVREVLITAGDLNGQQVRQLVEDGRTSGVTVKILPGYEQLLRGNIDLKPREVQIEDLLRRDPVQLDQTALHGWIDGQVMLVTGSAGSIGSELCRQLLEFSPSRLVLVDRSENGQFFLERELRRLAPNCDLRVCMADVTDGLRMDAIFREHRPQIVFHAAAYKHVPLMEENPGEAVKNITLATRLLADLSRRHDVASFVLISTDKAVNPTSVMGACKRLAELYVQGLAATSTCRFVTVRFGNVLDSAGSVVPIFRQQISRGGPVTVTHPQMRRFFMTIPEAAQLVIQAGAMGQGGEIFVLDMGEMVRILDLATEMIRLSGLRVGTDIEIEFVGIRPGEKLFEELHSAGETHLPTAHPKIQVAESDSPGLVAIRRALEHLATATEAPSDYIRQLLAEAVPHYEFDLTATPKQIAA